MELASKLAVLFADHFGYKPEAMYQAPGRVNLIGEHTDYNQGFVLPCAIDYQTVICIAKRRDNQVRIVAADYENAQDHFQLNEPIIPLDNPMWANYVRGVIYHLQQKKHHFSGMDMLIGGNVPQGAGLSSSASLEVALGTAINNLWQLPLTASEIALNGQQAENQFVGCNCGIMDQMISALGKANHALLLDCQSLQSEIVAMPAKMSIVIINSNFRRTLVGSEYNTRRLQCQAGAAFFNKPSLRDLTLTEFEAGLTELDPLIARRVRHVLTENQRTLDAATALRIGNLNHLGELMRASHHSMREDFEITVEPIDILVTLLNNAIGRAGGARMTGGGFGGCVVALIAEERVPEIRAQIANQYLTQTGIQETFYVCKATEGAGRVG